MSVSRTENLKKEQARLLYQAVLENNAEYVDIYLAASFPTNYIDPATGNSVLHAAIIKRNLKILTLLLDHQANLSVKNKQGVKPAELAGDNQWWTGLILMAEKKKPEIQDAYDYGCALLCAADSNQIDPMKALLKAGASINSRFTSNHNGPVHLAINAKNLKMLELLLDYGASLCKKNKDNKNPVRLAIDLQWWPGLIAMAQKRPGINEEYPSALLHGAKHKQWNLVKILSEAKVSINQHFSDDRNSVLHWALIHRHLPTVIRLHHRGSDLLFKNNDGLTPMALAQKLNFPLASEVLANVDLKVFKKRVRRETLGLLSILHGINNNEMLTKRPSIPLEIMEIIFKYAFATYKENYIFKGQLEKAIKILNKVKQQSAKKLDAIMTEFELVNSQPPPGNIVLFTDTNQTKSWWTVFNKQPLTHQIVFNNLSDRELFIRSCRKDIPIEQHQLFRAKDGFGIRVNEKQYAVASQEYKLYLPQLASNDDNDAVLSGEGSSSQYNNDFSKASSTNDILKNFSVKDMQIAIQNYSSIKQSYGRFNLFELLDGARGRIRAQTFNKLFSQYQDNPEITRVLMYSLLASNNGKVLKQQVISVYNNIIHSNSPLNLENLRAKLKTEIAKDFVDFASLANRVIGPIVYATDHKETIDSCRINDALNELNDWTKIEDLPANNLNTI